MYRWGVPRDARTHSQVLPSEEDERRAIQQIEASTSVDLPDEWYQGVEALRAGVPWGRGNAGSYARAMGRVRPKGPRDLERASIVVEGSAVLRPRPKTLRARPAQPPDGAPSRKDRKFCNPPPRTNDPADVAGVCPAQIDVPSGPWAARPSPGAWVDPRRASWALTEAVRPLGQARQFWCRRALVAGAAGLQGHKHGRLAWAGAETCGSLWACPSCSWRIRAHRGVELSELVRVIQETTPQTEDGLESHAGTGGLMLTLTLRHTWSDDLTELRRLLTRAWSRFIRGQPWERFRRSTGIVGFVRAIEVTHGRRGWHPHLHAMISGSPGWNLRRYAGMLAEVWLRRRWLACVRKEGHRDGSEASHVPSWAHALKLSPIRPGYLEKMGLELVLDRSKRGAHGNRTPWQIADDWRRCRRKREARLWQCYAASMKGAKFLTWSRALRAWVGLGASVRDRDVAADHGQPLGSLPAPAWRSIRDAIDFTTGRAVTLRALEIGERLGVRRALQYCWREAAPRMKGEGREHGKTEVRGLREAVQRGKDSAGLRPLPMLPQHRDEPRELGAELTENHLERDRYRHGLDGRPERGAEGGRRTDVDPTADELRELELRELGAELTEKYLEHARAYGERAGIARDLRERINRGIISDRADRPGDDRATGLAALAIAITAEAFRQAEWPAVPDLRHSHDHDVHRVRLS